MLGGNALVLYSLWRRGKTIRKKQRYVRFSLNQLNLMILWTDLSGQMLEMTEAVCQGLGYTRDTLMRSNLQDLLVPGDTEKWDLLLQQLRERKSCSIETAFITKNGLTLSVELAAHRLRYEGRDSICFVLNDISLCKHAEAELRESLQEVRDLRLTLDESVILSVADENFRIVYANDKFCKLSGYTREELMGQHHRIFKSGEHPPEFYQNLAETITEGRIYQGEIKNRAKDGSYFWLDMIIVPFSDKTGKPYEFVSISSDITEKKRVEAQELIHAQQQKVIADIGLMAVTCRNLDTILHVCANTIRDVLGTFNCTIQEVTPDENALLIKATAAASRDLEGLVVPLDENAHTCYTLRTGQPVIVADMTREERFTVSHVYRKYDIKSALSVIIYGEDKPYGTLSVQSKEIRQFTQDDIYFLQAMANILSACISRAKTDEMLTSYMRRLEQSNRDLSDFATIVSHDLKDPLRKIVTFGEKLRDCAGVALGEQGNDYLARIDKASRHMQALVEGLLSYSRVTTKAQTSTRVDLNEVLQNVISQLEVQLDRTQGQVIADPLPVITAEPLQMNQLFQNLVANALKFHKPDVPPVVRIHSRYLPKHEDSPGSGAGCYEITIEDNGIGFDERYAEQIFRIFERLSPQDKTSGSGVGLAICRKIVERHGGSITAHGTPGEGSRFVFRLPAHAEPGTPSPSSPRVLTEVG